MSHQDDDDDFFSADEDDSPAGSPTNNDISASKDDYDAINEMRISVKDQTIASSPRDDDDKIERSIKTSQPSSELDDIEKDSRQQASSDKKDGAISNDNYDDDEDEDDEDLAEKIRERNLKIARKYSAELAKSLKPPSAPINIDKKPTAPLGMESIHKSGLPPAPPPTPNVTTSFSSLDENMSQFPWQTPKSQCRQATEPSRLDEVASTSANREEINRESKLQARQVLDRLSDMTQSSSNQNLLSRVAQDIEKLTFSSQDQPDGPSLISDLSSWSWSGATKLIASASQVSAVLKESVSNVAQFPQQVVGSPESGQPDLNQGNMTDTKTSTNNSGKASFVRAPESISNDAIVDFTLSAMESLGKKAFNVMTDRDESGSLQIKGLGRPWEHFINSTKQTQPPSSGHVVEKEDPSDNVEIISQSSSLVLKPHPEISQASQSGLKMRKKRVAVDGQDD